MELQMLTKVVGPFSRSIQAVRDLLGKAPSVPLATQESEPQSRHQQWAAQENHPALNQPYQNIQSLTQPDTHSSLTSRLTNQDSIGSDILPTSSISQPPSELVAPLSKLAQAVVFDREVLVAPHWPMDAEMKDTFDRHVYERLSGDLEKNGKGVFVLEFFMAGKNERPPKLKPTIVITCINAESRKVIRSFLQQLYWLKEYRLQYVIVLNSQKRKAELFTKPLAVPDLSRLAVIANLGSNTSTLCGMSAALKHPRLQIDTPFKLGGMIVVKDEIFCLTIGHITNLELPHDLSEDVAISEVSQGDNIIDSDDSSCFFTIGGSASDSDVDSISDNSEKKGNEEDGGRIVHEDYSEDTSRTTSPIVSDWTEIGILEDLRTSRLMPHVASPRTQSDWALIRVTDKKYWLENAVQIPGNPALTAIEHTVPETQISAAQVWAVTGSHSLRPGLLSECPATLFLQGRTLRVRQITFERALVPGDSGTWVIQEGRLCGHIVAGRKGLNWAYMVTIQTIFDEIKECFNATDSEVSILTAPMATYLRLGDTIGPTLDLPHPKTPVEDPFPVAVETMSNATSRRQLREEENPAPSSHTLLQPEPISDASSFVNRFKRLRPAREARPSTFPQSYPQLATRRDNYASLDTSSAHERPDRETFDNARGLHRWHLGRWQVLMLVFSGVIGSNMYANDGKALQVAGPGGALIAFTIVGVITIAVMESISEMMQLFPSKNAMVEFVRVFVDEDLAWVVGLSYWYTYATIFASLVITAAQFSEYWGLSKSLQGVVFYILAPIILIVFNFLPIRYFGLIAAFAGLLKICFVAGCVLFMVGVSVKQHNGNKYIQAGIKHNDSVAKTPPTAIFYCIPFFTYGFLGVEIIIVMGAEARSHKILTWASRRIALLTMFPFLLLTILEFINISWLDARLPTIWFNTTDAKNDNAPDSTAVLVLVAQKYGIRVLPGLLTGCMIYSVLCASNTALYVASRSLYGVARHAQLGKRRLNWLSRPFSKVGTTSATGVPQWALGISAVSFIWIPFVLLSNDVSAQDFIGFITLSGTMSCLLVWACQCAAYIRCQRWLRKYDMHHLELYPRFDRHSPRYAGRTIMSSYQPLLAWLGLCGCSCIVFLCGSSLWWDSKATTAKIMGAYSAPIAIWATWSVRKLYLWIKYRPAITSNWLFVHVKNFGDFRKLLDGMSKPTGEDAAEEELRDYDRAAHTA